MTCGSSVSPATERFGLAVAVLIGLLVRVVPVVTAATVVGDGGFIHALVDDVRAAGLGLPTAASYNDLGIPFVYPPIALWVTAFIGEVFGASTLDLLRWLPVAISSLTVVTFAWLAHRSLGGLSAVGATFAYALMPSAYGWLVAGGGLTRGLGLLFALLAAAMVARRAPDASRWMAVVPGVLLGLSALTHPQAAVFGVVACMTLAFRRPVGAWLAQLAIAAASAVVVVLPWLIWVAGTNGLDAIFGAAGRLEPGIGIVRMLNLEFSAAPFMDIVGVVGVVGLIVAVARREWRLPIFLLAAYLLGSGGGEFLAAVPWALLAGVGVGALCDLIFGALHDAGPATAPRFAMAIGAGALFLALIGSIGSVSDRSSKLHGLGTDRIGAMEWMAANLPPDARAIVPTDEVWGYDDIGEWLPALAARHAIGTVQGSEWLGAEGFEAQLSAHGAIRACAGSTASCYSAIDPEAAIFVPKGQLNGIFSPDDCCPALRSTLTDAGYEVVYDGDGATIAVPGNRD
jgi:hypothetical protein